MCCWGAEVATHEENPVLCWSRSGTLQLHSSKTWKSLSRYAEHQVTHPRWQPQAPHADARSLHMCMNGAQRVPPDLLRLAQTSSRYRQGGALQSSCAETKQLIVHWCVYAR